MKCRTWILVLGKNQAHDVVLLPKAGLGTQGASYLMAEDQVL